MKQKFKRIMAIIGIVVIVGLYIWALVAAVFARPEANAMFMAAIISTVVVPALLYIYTWLGLVLSGKDVKFKEAEEKDTKKPSL